jgi:hypothetical protein
MSTKLVIVEGIPGSGKTTAAEFIRDWLAERGARTALYLEGDLDHPADFESVACLDEGEYARLLEQFPACRDLLEQRAVIKGGERFLGYRKLQLEFREQLPDELIRQLANYEIYELHIAKYHQLLLERWRAFAELAAQSNEVYIFECCFLQNPLTMYLGRHDEPIEAAKEHILQTAEVIASLDPILIYLHPGEAGETLRRVARVRPQEWLDFVIAYHTQQGHGKAQGWQGFEGMVKFYEMRQSIELDLLTCLPWRSLLVPHVDWAQDQARISAYLSLS